MSVIAEYTVSNPILADTRQAVPGVTLEVEDEQPVPGTNARLIVWARGTEADLERFFADLPDDPSITSFETLSTLPERRLFRITLSPEGERGLTYVDAIEHGITFLDIEANGDEMRYRAQVPDRDALVDYREQCQERGLSFDLRRLYRSDADTAARYGLTARQRDALCRAFEAGYFAVPREASTAELADEFDISSQAFSALLRRGHVALLGNTIADDEDRT
ncbi:helix-turn-helix domain-containing protein [Natronorubrum sulfidifaciens]|uniref:Bacterio-opsin activator HTH domain-containing protein n=1 Tax=Natronorubrum sulfidifaciens JCM 14089 TaxID=1230460 RepID=L9W149_9EURY|nr:helix-turn-helix domain-containing protein [Natronorubrum sulfidifaciens]ELY42023.1 Bacterio-opsin activator HTH domain-containing protein [Natronorubrum sulfidifaciens JCM 14089]